MIDIVRGVIIGDPWKTGQLFYDGRAQGPTFIADDDEGLRMIAKARKTALGHQLGREFDRLFPDASKWELRIRD